MLQHIAIALAVVYWVGTFLVLAAFPVSREDRLCVWVTVALVCWGAAWLLAALRLPHEAWVETVLLLVMYSNIIIIPLYSVHFFPVLMSAWSPARFGSSEQRQRLAERVRESLRIRSLRGLARDFLCIFRLRGAMLRRQVLLWIFCGAMIALGFACLEMVMWGFDKVVGIDFALRLRVQVAIVSGAVGPCLLLVWLALRVFWKPPHRRADGAPE